MYHITKGQFLQYIKGFWDSTREKATEKRAKDMSMLFTEKETSEMNIRKKCKTSPTIRKIQIKAIIQFSSTKLTKIKIPKTSCWEYRETGSILNCWQECKAIHPLWKQLDNIYQITNVHNSDVEPFSSHGTHKLVTKMLQHSKNILLKKTAGICWLIHTGWLLLCCLSSFFIWRSVGKGLSAPTKYKWSGTARSKTPCTRGLKTTGTQNSCCNVSNCVKRSDDI